MPKYGSHTREILQELGYSADEINNLIAEQVAGESWSRHYLPE